MQTTQMNGADIRKREYKFTMKSKTMYTLPNSKLTLLQSQKKLSTTKIKKPT